MTATPLKELTLPSQSNPKGYMPSLYLARLMTPSEVDQATRNRNPEERKRLRGRWMLCGDVSSRMFSRVKENPERLMFRISAFKSTLGGSYAVLTHQLEDLQHRFLLALYDKSVVDWLTSLEDENYGFLLGNNEERDAVILVGAVPAVHFRPLDAMSIDPESDLARSLLAELTNATAAFGALDAVPSIDSQFKVSDVSVSVLLPLPLLERQASMTGAAH